MNVGSLKASIDKAICTVRITGAVALVIVAIKKQG